MDPTFKMASTSIEPIERYHIYEEKPFKYTYRF